MKTRSTATPHEPKKKTRAKRTEAATPAVPSAARAKAEPKPAGESESARPPRAQVPTVPQSWPQRPLTVAYKQALAAGRPYPGDIDLVVPVLMPCLCGAEFSVETATRILDAFAGAMRLARTEVEADAERKALASGKVTRLDAAKRAELLARRMEVKP